MNTLIATVTSITSSEHLSSVQVSVDADTFHLLLAEQADATKMLAQSVTLVFKETEVILSKNISQTTANQHTATVEKIETGIILSQITLAYNGSAITALVPTMTFDPLMIVQGDTVYWLVQPSEISLLRGNNGI